LPTDSDIDDVTPLAERDILDQPTYQLLALHECDYGSMPDGRQILGKMANLLLLRRGKQEGCLLGHQGIFSLQLLDLSQSLIPSALQSTPGAVIVELPLVVQKVFPGDVARVSRS